MRQFSLHGGVNMLLVTGGAIALPFLAFFLTTMPAKTRGCSIFYNVSIQFDEALIFELPEYSWSFCVLLCSGKPFCDRAIYSEVTGMCQGHYWTPESGDESSRAWVWERANAPSHAVASRPEHSATTDRNQGSLPGHGHTTTTDRERLRDSSAEEEAPAHTEGIHEDTYVTNITYDDVAYEKLTAQSSNLSTITVSSNAVTNSSLCSQTDNSITGSHWWMVDLGAIFSIVSVSIDNAYDSNIYYNDYVNNRTNFTGAGNITITIYTENPLTFANATSSLCCEEPGDLPPQAILTCNNSTLPGRFLNVATLDNVLVLCRISVTATFLMEPR